MFMHVIMRRLNIFACDEAYIWYFGSEGRVSVTMKLG
jgi:hypothetical protein